jgi:hypothetical protein
MVQLILALIRHILYIVNLMPGKYRIYIHSNVLAKYWQSTGKVLEKYWKSTGKF